MKKHFILLATCALAGGLRLAALDAVVVVNNDVGVSELSAAALKDFLTGKSMYWDGGVAITIITAGDKADAALEAASGMGSSAFKTHWQRLAFSGRGQPPKKADDTDKALATVASTKGAIAVLPAGTEPKGVKKIDIK
jgi:ABC-type phosphate transport system substrate-binding protein